MAAGEAKAHNRYRVIERLESGGMAEVFRGEAESLAGFKKAVAIKRVLPHLAQNDKFIRMFLDEARLCARLNHANIVQVFDIGHVENTYFIVMEFVDGVNLKAIIEYLRNRGQGVPIPVAVYLSMQICNGLQYAHELQDSDGSTLGIVHRDMSPPNVLVSKRGEVKIVDFGLAKATTQLEKSEQGMVKGKFGYLAPETALGQEVDAQVDVFAVGIMLWEMIANKRLFLADSDWATVQLVQKAQIPSLRKFNAEVPPDLEAVINKSLAKDKNERYRTAEALAQDLGEFLAKHRMAVNSFDIAKITKEAIEERRAQKAKEKRPEQDLIDKLIMEELGRFTSLGEDEDPNAEGSKPIDLASVGAAGQPLDPGSLVDTNDWASNMFEGDDFDPSKLGAPTADLASQLEGDDLSPAESPPPTEPQKTPELTASDAPPAADKTADKTDDKAEKPRVGSAAIADSIPTTEPKQDKAEKKGNGALLAVVGVLALGAIGAGLWFAGIIPH
ncbi:MAG: serine/threonine protein kinase [Myxococcales bacterium]|nr:serine/threonine protein kinase [Myxococcales bacterium]